MEEKIVKYETKTTKDKWQIYVTLFQPVLLLKEVSFFSHTYIELISLSNIKSVALGKHVNWWQIIQKASFLIPWESVWEGSHAIVKATQ